MLGFFFLNPRYFSPMSEEVFFIKRYFFISLPRAEEEDEEPENDTPSVLSYFTNTGGSKRKSDHSQGPLVKKQHFYFSERCLKPVSSL